MKVIEGPNKVALLLRGKNCILMLLLKKEKISKTAGGEKKEASCLFPSLAFGNPEEGGENPPKRCFKKKREKINWCGHYTTFTFSLI